MSSFGRATWTQAEKDQLVEDAATWLEKASEVLTLNPRSAAQMALRAQALAEMVSLVEMESFGCVVIGWTFRQD